MARIRMIKPEFFDDPDVAELSMAARLFFIGLWTEADKEGRLVDDMRRLKARIFPFDEVDVETLAVELHGKDMIRRYSTGEKHGFIFIRNFTKHQRPHPKEPASLIPACENEAGKRNGEPGKETVGTPESGVLILDSGSLESGGRTASTTRKPHRRHVFCPPDDEGFCVPEFLHGQLLTMLGAHGDGFDILGWYRDTDFARSRDRPTVGDMLEWWREELRSTMRAKGWLKDRTIRQAAPSTFVDWNCPHETKCHDGAFRCNQRTQLEAAKAGVG